MMFIICDMLGVFVDVLMGFWNGEVNLVKLESCFIFGNFWEEMFIMDVEGYVEDKVIKDVMVVFEEYMCEIK